MSDEDNKPGTPEQAPGKTPEEKPGQAEAATAVAEKPSDKDDDLPEGEKAETTIPEIEDRKVPLWIKLMWLGFFAWLIWYIIMGLQSSPDKWA